MRELHAWEKDPAARAAEEKLIQLLIGDEPEEGMQNLREVDIPEDVEKQLQKSYKAEQKDIEEEICRREEGRDEGQGGSENVKGAEGT